MSESTLLKVDGEVERPLALSQTDLAAIDAEFQVADVSRLHAKRRGDAVQLAGLLKLAGAKPSAKYITLHASADDFHASVPLDAIRESALLIYRLDDAPLPISAGGPLRFFIPDCAACHTHEIDECANVKFVDRIEISSERGFDNRPAEERQHAELHRRQEAKSGER